jgi:outer membrane protein
MLRSAFALLIVPALLPAEIHVLTLKQALERATTQSPDVLIAKFNEQIAAQDVRIARGPFHPRVIVGSGLAYTSGFPMSIEGSAPSIIQAQALQSIYNRPLSYKVAAAKEMMNAAGVDTASARDEAIYRVAALFMDAERFGREADLAEKQVAALEKVATVVEARVKEDRDLEIENKRAALSVAQGKQKLQSLRSDQEATEANLAILLAFPPEDQVRPAQEERNWAVQALSETEAAEQALSANNELRKLEVTMRAKALEVQSAKSARYPTVDLVAQYGLFAKYNNWEDYFRSFQRNNGELGVSVAFPLLPGRASGGETAKAELEMARMRTQFNATRDRVAVSARQSFTEVRKAQTAREVARLDLEVAREQLTILLAQMQEGRAGLRQVEEARSAEMLRWMALYEAEAGVERARLQLLRQTGGILAALK